MRTGRRSRYVLAALLAAGGGVLIAPQTAHAATISCDNTSLISAITAANGTTGGGTVTLPAGCTFTLTAVDNTVDGNNGLPDITNNVTVDGNGATITRGSGAPEFRFFFVDNTSAAADLTLNSLTLSNGAAQTGQSHGGGAILNGNRLSVSNVTFTNDVALDPNSTGGGAIDNHDGGQATITGSSFTGNRGEEGGAVEDEATQAGAFVNVSQSTFTNNDATIYGGGGVENQPGGSDTLTADTFVNNTALEGGGIANGGTMTLTNSTLVGNTERGNGGGGIQNYGRINVQQTTLSGNGGPGGGADLHTYVPSGTSVTTAVTQTIIANGVTSSNCSGSGPITGNGYNLDTGGSCGFSAATHSLSNTQPQLEALASNGGPTQTMALPTASPAVDAIPASVTGCTGSTDQRGVSRPQGVGCDIGAYELIVTTGDTQPPTVPTGLAAPSVSANAVTLTWNQSTDNVGVSGYTVYRNGSAVGVTGGAAATTFTDNTAAPSTTYSYTVDAFDGSGNHSAQSTPLPVTTPAPSGVQFAQGGATATATRVTTATIPLTGTVGAGDLLVGWFGQYDATGTVQVSDNINGAWTRSSSITYTNGGGDIALYYVQNAAASTYGLTITIASSSATYLTGVAGDYHGVADAAALDTVTAGRGVGTLVDSGPTAPVSAGELVVGAILTGTSPGSTTAGASDGDAFAMRAQTASGSADLEDVLNGAAGVQHATATLGTAADWYAVAAVFHQFGGGVGPSPAATTTQASPTTGSVGANATFGDTATVSGANGVTPTGTVQFTLYQGAGCTGAAELTSGQIPLVPGTAPVATANYSASWTPPASGNYYWFAKFTSGDSNYTGSQSGCSDATELVAVGSSSTTTTTQASPTTGSVGTNATFGDTATVSGANGVTPTGTVQFTLYQGAGCTGAAELTSGQIPLVPGTAPVATANYSASWTPPASGNYYWFAKFTSGDSNYTGSQTGCSDSTELVTVSATPQVSQITPTTTTCQQFANGTGASLSSVTYASKGTTISSTNPAALSYWVRVAVSSAGSESYTIPQATTYAPTKGTGFLTLASGSVAFGPTCKTLTTHASGGTAANPNVAVGFSAAAPGTYFIRVNYSTKSLVGSGPAFTSQSSGSYTYTFQTSGVASSTEALLLAHR